MLNDRCAMDAARMLRDRTLDPQSRSVSDRRWVADRRGVSSLNLPKLLGARGVNGHLLNARGRILAVLTILVTTVATVFVVPGSAQAAVWYWYEPSQLVTNKTLNCTGGFMVRSLNNNSPYIMTAGH